MAKVYLLLGGNQGDRFYSLNKATELIEQEVGNIIRMSSFYETEPWGFEHEDEFWNQVLVIESDLEPIEILNITQDIEARIGRVRKKNQYCERIIDIDILFYNDIVMDEERLTIPHPKIQERRFTLAPLAELDAEFIHPVSQKSVGQLLNDCKDLLKVSRLEESVLLEEAI